MKKTIYTLNVNDYSPEITAITYPLLRYYANKIGADFHIIDKRMFPDYPVTYEKLQIHRLGQIMENDWNIYIDSDALIHPETPDWTEHLTKDTVAHNGSDMANIRWKYDNIFRRDGRNIGSCNWFTIASDWCIDLWQPLDILLEDAIENIYLTVEEMNTVITREHLIDDYALSRNIAKYGFKFTTLGALQKVIGLEHANFHYHIYTVTGEQKVVELTKIVNDWKVPESIKNYGK